LDIHSEIQLDPRLAIGKKDKSQLVVPKKKLFDSLQPLFEPKGESQEVLLSE
jgi:hypothetical protein